MAALKIVIFNEKYRAQFTNQQEVILLDLLKKRFDYPEKIRNPAFDTGQPVSESNPVFIDNPEPAETYLARTICEDLTSGMTKYRISQLTVIKNAEAKSEGEADLAGIVVEPDVP